ncbi:ribonuclease H2, subunit C [Limtongia smithiae]|uniref:ribonuclease H2, subunit C n=1 Tax=Limtongia smithiae TaxID=1125753 RepID=UPI0034CE16C4
MTMSPTVTISTNRAIEQVAVHVVPCKINHDGRANTRRHFKVRRYTPEKRHDRDTTQSQAANAEGAQSDAHGDKDDTVSGELRETHFRGRRFLGQHVPLPKGYTGLILPPAQHGQCAKSLEVHAKYSVYDDESSDDAGSSGELMWEPTASFSSITVWGHDIVPDGAESPWISGVQQWIAFANIMHGEEVS